MIAHPFGQFSYYLPPKISHDIFVDISNISVLSCSAAATTPAIQKARSQSSILVDTAARFQRASTDPCNIRRS